MATIENATEIHPFHVDVPEEELADLRSRIAATMCWFRRCPATGSRGNQRLPAGTHIADAWIILMRRLHYTRFVAQGGNWGAQITGVMGAKASPELLGIHSSMPGTVPPEVAKALASNILGAGDPAPSGLSADEQRAYDRLSFLFTKGIGYALEMGLRPQTLYGLADSPIVLAAWMLDHDAYSYEDIAQAFDGDPIDNLTRDEVLDNITLTWVTNTGCPRAVSTGRTPSASSTSRAPPSRQQSASSLESSIRPCGAGPSRPTPTSSISTKSTKATTSRPGKSLSSSPPRCEPPSDHFEPTEARDE
jgi:hypothetical protein